MKRSTASRVLRVGRAGRAAASMGRSYAGARGPGAYRPAPAAPADSAGGDQALVGDDLLRVLGLAALDHVEPVVGERGVPVLVDRVGAEHALAVLLLEKQLGHLGPVVGLRPRCLQHV